MKRVAILVLNWNNWQDTLACLESVLQLDYPEFQVIVCDNGSTDDSLARIRQWATGRLDSGEVQVLPGVCMTPCPKPVCMAELDRGEAEEGKAATEPLLLVNNGANLGFAGGNNVGLRYVLNSAQFDFCWVLNNDTLVAADALQKLIERACEEDAPGLCGSTLLEYHAPDRINAFGGALYSRWLGLAWHLGRGRRWPSKVDRTLVEKRMDYIVGASLFVSYDFLREIGLMEEDYFLYYEELDWATRARGRFTLAWAPGSRVYHKVGGTIGTSSHPARKSMLSDFYTLRNRISFTRRFCPWALPTIYLGLIVAIGYRLLFGQGRKAIMVGKLMFDSERTYEDVCRE